MMTWCSYNAMSCHLILMWHEWNAISGDVMVTWFTSYANLVTSRWACTSHACMHGAHALSKMGMTKYSNSLTGMPADLNLRKLTTSHFWVLITQNAIRTCQTCSPLCISIRTCDVTMRIEHRVNENPSFIPTCFGTEQKVRKWQKLHFTLFTCRYHNF